MAKRICPAKRDEGPPGPSESKQQRHKVCQLTDDTSPSPRWEEGRGEVFVQPSTVNHTRLRRPARQATTSPPGLGFCCPPVCAAPDAEFLVELISQVQPKRNAEMWRKRIFRNCKRDRLVARKLRTGGGRQKWERVLAKLPAICLQRLIRALRMRSNSS
jgi:hypothetical protein